MTKPTNSVPSRKLNDDELASVAGGDARKKAQMSQTLSSAVSEVVKNIGNALQTAARG